MVSNVNSTKLTKSTSCQVLRMDDFIRRKKKYNAKTNSILSRMEKVDELFTVEDAKRMVESAVKNFEKDDKAIIKGAAKHYLVYCSQLLKEFYYMPLTKLIELFSNLEYSLIRKNKKEIYIEVSNDFLDLSYREAEEEIAKARRFTMDQIYAIGREDEYMFLWTVDNMFVPGFSNEVKELNKKYNREEN